VEVNAADYLEFPNDTVTRKPTTGIAGCCARNMGPAGRYAAENAYQRATASAEPGSPVACTHN